MEAAAYLGAPTATIHVNSRVWYEIEEDWEPLLATLYELGEYGRLLGVQVGVETGYPRNLATFLRIIREVNHPMVSATLDVGHVAFSIPTELRDTETGIQQYNDDLEMLCRELGDKIIHLHIYDVRREDWRDHRQVGTGVIDWPRLFTNLNGIYYTGLLELEMEEQDREGALLWSKAQMETLLQAGSLVEREIRCKSAYS